MSTTPRTKAIFDLLAITWHPETDYEHFVAAKEGARCSVEDIERRNAELTARIAELERESKERHEMWAHWQTKATEALGNLSRAEHAAKTNENAFNEALRQNDNLRAQLAEARKDSARLESLKLRIREQIGWVDFHHLQSVVDGKVELSGDCIRDLRNFVSNLQTLALPATPLPEKEGQL